MPAAAQSTPSHMKTPALVAPPEHSGEALVGVEARMQAFASLPADRQVALLATELSLPSSAGYGRKRRDDTPWARACGILPRDGALSSSRGQMLHMAVACN